MKITTEHFSICFAETQKSKLLWDRLSSLASCPDFTSELTTKIFNLLDDLIESSIEYTEIPAENNSAVQKSISSPHVTAVESNPPAVVEPVQKETKAIEDFEPSALFEDLYNFNYEDDMYNYMFSDSPQHNSYDF